MPVSHVLSCMKWNASYGSILSAAGVRNELRRTRESMNHCLECLMRIRW